MAETGFYLRIWLGLLTLLALNIGGWWLGLGLGFALLIAAGQAFAILAYFMYLHGGAPLVRIAAGVGFFWLAIMMGLVMSDYLSRGEDIALGRLLPESSPAVQNLAP